MHLLILNVYMLGLFLYQDFKFIFKVKNLQEIAFNLLALFQGFLTSLYVSMTLLLSSGHLASVLSHSLLSLFELGSHSRELHLSLASHTPCILQAVILGYQLMLHVLQSQLMMILKGLNLLQEIINLLLAFLYLLLKTILYLDGFMNLVLQFAKLVLLLQYSPILLFQVRLKLCYLLLEFL